MHSGCLKYISFSRRPDRVPAPRSAAGPPLAAVKHSGLGIAKAAAIFQARPDLDAHDFPPPQNPGFLKIFYYVFVMTHFL